MKKLILFFAVLFAAVSVHAQTITGVVMDEVEPIIGANIMVKGTTNGTITDIDGNFELQTKVGDVLVVSYMGYKTQEVKATAAPMRITLVPDNVMLGRS